MRRICYTGLLALLTLAGCDDTSSPNRRSSANNEMNTTIRGQGDVDATTASQPNEGQPAGDGGVTSQPYQAGSNESIPPQGNRASKNAAGGGSASGPNVNEGSPGVTNPNEDSPFATDNPSTATEPTADSGLTEPSDASDGDTVTGTGSSAGKDNPAP